MEKKNKERDSIKALNEYIDYLNQDIDASKSEIKRIEKEIEKRKSGTLRTYQTRPEVDSDFEKFLNLAGDKVVDVEFVSRKSLFYDSVKFNSTLSYYEILDIMNDVIDGHIMRETLDFTEDYTGERNFDVE